LGSGAFGTVYQRKSLEVSTTSYYYYYTAAAAAAAEEDNDA